MILHPYFAGLQYRIHILRIGQNQAAITRVDTDPDPIYGNSCVGYRIIIKNKNKGLEERNIETKLQIFKKKQEKKTSDFKQQNKQ